MEGHGPRIGGNSSAGCIPRFITFFTTCSQRCRQFPKQQTRISMIIGGFLWLLSDMHAQREKQYFYFRLKSWPIWGTFTPCLFRLLLSIPNPNIQRISSIRARYSVYCHLYRKFIPSIAAESPKHYGTCGSVSGFKGFRIRLETDGWAADELKTLKRLYLEQHSGERMNSTTAEQSLLSFLGFRVSWPL